MKVPRLVGGNDIGGGTSRKHHKKKRGIKSRGRYAMRLAARGLTSKSVHMRPLEDLRKRAEREKVENGND